MTDRPPGSRNASIAITIALLVSAARKTIRSGPPIRSPRARGKSGRNQAHGSTMTLTWTGREDNETRARRPNTISATRSKPRRRVASASMVTGAPRPKPAGGADTCVVTGLDRARPITSRSRRRQRRQLVGKIEHPSAATTAMPDDTPPAARHGSRRERLHYRERHPCIGLLREAMETRAPPRYTISAFNVPLNDATWAFAMQASGSRPRSGRHGGIVRP